MDLYLSQTRIEGPIWLEPSDLVFLQTRVLELETEIERNSKLEGQKLDCIRQKEATLVEIASIRNILSPIRRVPFEILSEILALSCLPAYGSLDAHSDIVYNTYTISSVCLAWRRAAHASPQMWSKLCIDNESHRRIVMSDAGWVKEWFALSQGLPLELHLRFWCEMEDGLGRAESRLLERILDFRHQFQYLDLAGDQDAYHALFCLQQSSLPSLERISLSLLNASYPFPDEIGVFLGAPRLHHVGLWSDPYVSLLTSLILPVEQLTSLVIIVDTDAGFDSDPAVYVDTLSQCKNLEYLRFHPMDDQGFFNENRISLHVLKVFEIALPKLYTGSGLLCSITAPLLEDLTLHCDGQEFPTIAAEVVQFQNYSKVTLSSLTLKLTHRVEEVTLTDLCTILATFPSVKSFWLCNGMYWRPNNSNLTNSLLGAMINDGHTVLLPRLEVFGLSYRSPRNYSYPLNLMSMILSRWRPKESKLDEGDIICLQKVTLCCIPGDLKEITLQLSSLHGLTVEYVSRPGAYNI